MIRFVLVVTTVFAACVSSFADQTWAFRIKGNDVIGGGLYTSIPKPVYTQGGLVWHCEVSKAQYDAGWDALPAGLKSAKKAQAEDDAADTSKKDATLDAISRACLDAINELRLLAGTNALSKADWKKRIKDKLKD